jgi:carboxypeptidase Q
MKNFNRAGKIALMIIAVFAGISLAQQDTSQRVASRIVGSILVNGHSLNYLQELTDGLGGRVSGSQAYQRASEWAADKFRSAGINNVKLEPFTLPNGWERISAHAQMITPLNKPLHVHSYGWSPSTPPGGVRGEVIYLRHILSQDDIKQQAGKIRGCVVLISGESFFRDEQYLDSKYIASKRLLKEIGALAMLVRGSETNNITSSWDDMWGGKLEPLPVAEIGMEDGRLIQRLLGKGPVSIELQCENKITGPVEVNNVVAEIRGREKPDEWILVSSHLDSWDQGTGAQDDACGCAMVLEAARSLAQLDVAPRRSIRFILWGGEEQGLVGSTAYFHSHASETKNCVVAMNTGLGAGLPQGWIVRGNNDLKKALQPISQALIGLDGDGLKTEIKFEELTDWESSFLVGIPTLDLWKDVTSYWEIHNKPGDTFDKVDSHSLATSTAIIATTAYWIADQPLLIAPHLDQTAIDLLLKKAEVYDRIKDLRDLGILP